MAAQSRQNPAPDGADGQQWDGRGSVAIAVSAYRKSVGRCAALADDEPMEDDDERP